MLREYYNIKFYHADLLKGKYQYLNFANKITLEDNIVEWIFDTNICMSDLISNKEKIEKVLRTNVLEIKRYNGSFSLISFTTSKKVINYKNQAKNGKKLSIKFESAFKLNGIKIYDIESELKDYTETIYFNSDSKKKDIQKVVPEIQHLTGINNFIIYSARKTDFKIIIKHSIPVIDFFDMLKTSILDYDNNIILGIDSEGRKICVSLFDFYHTIVAGSTGFGKSNMAHVVISSLIKSPLDIAIILLDVKKSELKRYRDISNVFYTGEAIEILETLKKMAEEMDRRNNLFGANKFIKDINHWNAKHPGNKLNYICIYVEEISDLILSSDNDYRKEFKATVIRLAQLGRSAGIRMFLSTQYPKKEIIDTTIKSNCASRCGFGVIADYESKVILDNPLAKGLKIGEMILQTEGQNIKIKVPFLKEKDVEKIVSYLEKTDTESEKPISKIFVSDMSNMQKNSTIDMTENKKVVLADTTKNTDIKYKINSSSDLFKFYNKFNDNGIVLSLNKSLAHTTIGRTKLQQYRRELINDKYLLVEGKNVYINQNHINE
jgi:hypothetical protein